MSCARCDRCFTNRPTLVLFYDDYSQWELLGVPSVSSTRLGSPIPAPTQPTKPWTYGQPIDFDSVDAATLDRFDYVITTRTTYQSEPPPNFHLVGSSRSYQVWQADRPDPAAHGATRIRPARGDPRLREGCW